MGTPSQNTSQSKIIKNAEILESTYEPLPPHKNKKDNKNLPENPDKNWTQSKQYFANTKENRAITYGIIGIATNIVGGFIFGVLALKKSKEAEKLGKKPKIGKTLGIASIIAATLSALIITITLPKSLNTQASQNPEIHYTPPGTELTLGETATIPHISSGDPIDINVTPTKLYLAPKEDIGRLKIDNQINNANMYYLHYNVTKISENPVLHLNFDNNMRGTLETNQDAQSVIIQGQFTPCPAIQVTENFNKNETIEACRIMIIPQENRLKSISWKEATGEYSEKNQHITWIIS